MLIEYVTNEDGERIGLMIAFSPDVVTYSLCAESDRFNKADAKQFAWERLLDYYADDDFNLRNPFDVPYNIHKALEAMQKYEGKIANSNERYEYLIYQLREFDRRINTYYKGIR